MKRKMICASMFYMLGLFFASFFTDWLVTAILVIISVIAGIAAKRKEILLAVFSFIIGFGFFSYYSRNIYEEVIDYAGKEVSFCGRIERIDIYENARAGFILSGEINSEQKAKIVFYWEDYSCNIGDEIEFVGALNEIESDYLFDAESYYKSQKIFLKANAGENIKLIKHSGFNIRQALYSYRSSMISDFNRKLGAKEGAFLSGMIFGEKNILEYTEKNALYRSGIGHVMAVSGLHTVLVAAIVMYILKKLKLSRYTSFAILAAVMLAMIVTVNFTVSVIRAVIMILIVYSARLFLRESDTFNSLSIAMLIIAIENPFVIYSSGFWLSVCGTFGIGVAAPYFCKEIKNKAVKSFVSTLCASVAVMLPSLYYFGGISAVSVLSNMIIIPLCMPVIAVGVIYVLSGGFISLLYPVKYIIRFIIALSDFIGSFGFSYMSCDKKLIPVIAAVMAFIFIVKIVTQRRKITAAVTASGIVFFLILSVFSLEYDSRKFTVAVLGNNENAAVCITKNDKAIVIDLSGNAKTSRYVEKYLNQRGINAINSLYLTKNQNSQLSAYSGNITAETEKLYLSGELAFSDNMGNIKTEKDFYSDGLFESDCFDYKITYKDGLIEIKSGERCITIAESGNSMPQNSDVTIYYGRISKNDIIDANGIYLDETENALISGLNNFTLTEKSGNFIIRRL